MRGKIAFVSVSRGGFSDWMTRIMTIFRHTWSSQGFTRLEQETAQRKRKRKTKPVTSPSSSTQLYSPAEQSAITSTSALWDNALMDSFYLWSQFLFDYKGQIHFLLSFPFYFNQNILSQSNKARLDYIQIERLNPITTFKTFYAAFSQGFTIAHWPAVLE